MATVADYYVACKQSAASDAALDAPDYMFSDFSRYLVASCWLKMRKRVIHWTSLGFLHILGKLDETQLQKIFDDHHATLQPSLRTDVRLFEELSRLSAGSNEGGDLLSQIMTYHPMSASEPQSSSKLQQLVTALSRLQRDNSQNLLGAYTRDTCYEFHRLLIATIFCYGKMLRNFNKYYRNGDKTGCERSAHNILQVGNLLWRIAYSRMLAQHLSLLQEGAFLNLPTSASEYHYRAYASSFVHQTCKKPWDWGDRLRPNDNGFRLGSKNDNEVVGARQDHVHEGSGKGATKGGEGRDMMVAEVIVGDSGQEGGA